MFFCDHDLPLWANRIRQLTKQSGLSQSEIARRAGVNRDAFGRYHNGVTRPPAQKLLMIAQAFDVRPSEIDPEATHLDKAKPETRKSDPYRIGPPSTGKQSAVQLDVSCEVPVAIAMQVIDILQGALEVEGKD